MKDFTATINVAFKARSQSHAESIAQVITTLINDTFAPVSISADYDDVEENDQEFIEPEDQDPGDALGLYDEREQP